MKKVSYDLKSWREKLPEKTSKAGAARKLGMDIHAYTRYEEGGMCPLYIKLAAMMVKLYEG